MDIEKQHNNELVTETLALLENLIMMSRFSTALRIALESALSPTLLLRDDTVIILNSEGYLELHPDAEQHLKVPNFCQIIKEKLDTVKDAAWIMDEQPSLFAKLTTLLLGES